MVIYNSGENTTAPWKGYLCVTRDKDGWRSYRVVCLPAVSYLGDTPPWDPWYSLPSPLGPPPGGKPPESTGGRRYTVRTSFLSRFGYDSSYISSPIHTITLLSLTHSCIDFALITPSPSPPLHKKKRREREEKNINSHLVPNVLFSSQWRWFKKASRLAKNITNGGLPILSWPPCCIAAGCSPWKQKGFLFFFFLSKLT